MFRSERRIPTEGSSRRLQQICTHFAHQTAVVYTPLHGHVIFPFGSCRLEAAGALLVVTLEADEASALARLEDLLAGQLERLALGDLPGMFWTGLEGLKF